MGQQTLTGDYVEIHLRVVTAQRSLYVALDKVEDAMRRISVIGGLGKDFQALRVQRDRIKMAIYMLDHRLAGRRLTLDKVASDAAKAKATKRADRKAKKVRWSKTRTF